MWRNKRRTLITGASIFFAVFFAVVMRSYQLGTYEHMIHQAIESYSGYIQIQDKEYVDDPNLDNSIVYDNKIISKLNSVENVKVAVPRVETFSLAAYGIQTKGVLVCGIDPIKEKDLSNPEIRIVKYRFDSTIVKKILKEIDVPEKQVELLKENQNQSYSSIAGISLDLDLNDELEKKLIPTIIKYSKFNGNYLKEDDDGVLVSDRLSKFLKVTVGDTIVLLGSGYHGSSAAGLFPVRGIVKILSPELDNKLVYITLKQSQEFLSLENRITSLNINLHDPDLMIESQNNVINSINSEQLKVINWEEFNPTLKQQIEGDSVGGVIFIGILYFIVLFGIFGTVVMMLAERKRELGVMVAIGMSKAKLSLVLIIEMLFLGFTGMISGLIACIPFIILGQKYPLRFTGELAKMYEDMGFDPVMPLAGFDQYFYMQGVIIMLMVLIACYIPLRSVRKMKVINSLRA